MSKNKSNSKHSKVVAKTQASTKKAVAKKVATGTKSALDTVQQPAKLFDACIAFNVKEVRAAVAAVTEALAMSKDSSTDNTSEVSVMLAFEKDDTCCVIFARGGGAARYNVPCKVFKPGSDRAVVVPATLFRAISGEFVTLAINSAKNEIHFVAGRINGNIQIPNTVEEYATMLPVDVPKAKYSIPTSVIDGIVPKILFPSFDPSLPLLGLPLHILVKKGQLKLSSNDSLVCAMYEMSDVQLDPIDVVVPGQALMKITKISKADTVLLGFAESCFRMKTPEIDIVHPTGVYDLFDMQGFIKDEQKEKPDFELELVTAELTQALDAVMCLSVVDHGEGKVTLEFDAHSKSGKAIFSGTIAGAKQKFEISEVIHKSKSMTVITDGKRLAAFVSMLKLFKTFTMRVHNSRAFMSAPDNSFVFMLPLA